MSSFKVAMRVVPNAGNVQLFEVSSIEELWQIVTPKINWGIWEPKTELYLVAALTKRVLFYIEADNPLKSDIAGNFGLNFTNEGRILNAGTGGYYEWVSVNPRKHPDFNAVMAAFKKAQL